MDERAQSFGGAAEDYERFRFGYPEQVVDRILAAAGRPVRDVLEIGAGTGKATRLLARPGVHVTATDPDAAMLQELRAHVPSSVAVVQAAFEQLPLDHAYDLVLAAASLHWTRADGRWERVAALLVPGGVVASFGGPCRLADASVERAVRGARAGTVENDEVASPDGTPETAALQWPGTELERSALFVDVQQWTVARRLSMSADDWVGHLSTVSAYLVLPVPERREVLRRVRAVLPARVDIDADVVVHTARRI